MEETSSGTSPLMRMALWYGARGHAVFPCHSPRDTGCSCRAPDCPNLGKHPRTVHGLDDASCESKTITRWWTQFPDANIGLRTGPTCFAVDADPRHGGDETLREWARIYGPLPDTPLSLTGGGGTHHLFKPPAHGRIPTRVGIGPGVDIRGDRGYIIVPPSLHASGNKYLWDSAYDIEDTDLAPAPDWLLRLCQDTTTHRVPDEGTPITDGLRNTTLSRMAFSMRKMNMSLEAIYAGVAFENETRCVPPLSDDELRKIVEGKRQIAPDPVFNPSQPGSRNGQKKDSDEPRVWPALRSADDILAAQYPIPRWLIQGLIAEGMTIIGGLPKVAKSYLAYDIALACAGQGLGLNHFGVSQGRVAYLAIEDDASDTQGRMHELRPGVRSIPNLFFLHGEDVPSISEGLLEYLKIKVVEHELSLVVIDPLSYVYDPPTGKQAKDSFREAKDMLLPLRQLARELHFSLIFVDHRRKQGKDDHDVFQTLYGSVAKYAVADTLIMAVRNNDEVVLHCKGRKIKDQAISCTFTYGDGTAVWAVQGAQEEYASNTMRAKILEAFKTAEAQHHRRTLSVSDAMDYAGIEQTALNKDHVKSRMFKMYKAGELLRTDRGLYLLAGDDDSPGVEI